MSLLLAGGSGFIGRALAHYCRTKGLKVYVVTRKPKGNDEISWSSIKDNGIPDNVQTIVNLSGRNVGEMSPLYLFNKYYKPFRQELYDSRLSTTKLLVEAVKISSKPPNLFINSSAIGIYMPSLLESYTESSAYVKHDMFTDLCKQWESVAQIPDKPNIRQIQLRTGLVLGCGGGMLETMYIPFKLGLGGVIGDGNQWMSWIHIEDIIGIIDYVIQNKTVVSGPLNATAPNPVTNRQFVSTLARTLNRPALVPMPSFAAKLMMGERASLLLEGQRVIPSRILQCGYQFKYERLDDALRSIYH